MNDSMNYSGGYTYDVDTVQLKMYSESKPNVTFQYKFKEDEYLRELDEYIKATYNAHYSKGGNKIQSFEQIAQGPNYKGLSFAIGNVQKYSARQGLKAGEERNDILKIVHYGLLALYCYDNIDINGNIKN